MLYSVPANGKAELSLRSTEIARCSHMPNVPGNFSPAAVLHSNCFGYARMGDYTLNKKLLLGSVCLEFIIRVYYSSIRDSQ
jgi:hypothetical protein